MDALSILSCEVGSVLSDELLKIIHIPSYQRILDSESIERIDHMIQQQTRRLEKGDVAYFPGVLHLAKVPGQSLWDVIDGQHRVRVLQALPQISVYVQGWTVSTPADIRGLMKLINVSKPIHGYELSADASTKDIFDTLRKYLEGKYKACISLSSTPKRPQINVARLIERIENENILQTYNIQSALKLIAFLEIHNERLRVVWSKSNDSSVRLMVEKCNKVGLYLGMDPLEQYLLHTIDIVERPHIEQEIESLCTKKRKTIPSKVRDTVWRRSFGATKDGTCYVCSCSLTDLTFECGHIQSVKEGGADTVDNLVPICGPCNRSMGSEHLEAYKKRWHP